MSTTNILKQLKDFTINKEVYKYYEYEYEKVNYKHLKSLSIKGISTDKLKKLLIPYYNYPLKCYPSPTSLSRITLSSNKQVYLKLENQNPSGSFKDRESAVAFNYLLSNKIIDAVIASSGNAAVSAAYYANLAGINLTCFIPSDTSKLKVAKILNWKANLKKFDVDFAAIYRNVADNFKSQCNISSGRMYLRSEGNKGIAYELFEQLKGVPDIIFVPIGNGGCFSGIWKGFYDLKNLNLITEIPYMIGVVHESSNVIKECIKNKILPCKIAPNADWSHLAEGIVGSEAFCLPKVIHILNRNEGMLIEVNDIEIEKVIKKCGTIKLVHAEPTSLTVLAAIEKYNFQNNKVAVAVITGGNN